MSSEQGIDWATAIAGSAAEARALDPFVARVEPTPQPPLDLTNFAGVFQIDSAMSIHPCAHCKRGIHVGRAHVARRLTPTSAVTDYYHRECVILP